MDAVPSSCVDAVLRIRITLMRVRIWIPLVTFDSYPDPAFHFDTVPDPDPIFQIKVLNLKKVRKLAYFRYILACHLQIDAVRILPFYLMGSGSGFTTLRGLKAFLLFQSLQSFSLII
jgi:hypothetical protein